MRLLRRRSVIITLLGIAVVSPCAAAAAARGDDARGAWATVNVCDTAAAPNTIGIRASMPGTRSALEERFVRFVVQYYSRATGRWHRIAEGGDSGYLSAGKRRKPRQVGRSFRIEPIRGEPVLLRGKVFFRWKVRGVIVRRDSELTRKGHRSSAGDDPPGYSAATCLITP
jgi:hypothetical protein